MESHSDYYDCHKNISHVCHFADMLMMTLVVHFVKSLIQNVCLLLLRAASTVRCFVLADGNAVSGAQDGGQLHQHVGE